jgi:hypothetical protein
VTTSDEKQSRKLKAWEESRLSNDELSVAVKAFYCHTLDETTLTEDDPFAMIIRKHRAPSFIVMYRGDLLYGSGMKPTASKLYSILKSSISKIYGLSLDKVVKEGLGIKKKLDRIEETKKLLNQRLSRMKPNDSRMSRYTKEKDSLETEEKSLRKAEQELFAFKTKPIVKA